MVYTLPPRCMPSHHGVCPPTMMLCLHGLSCGEARSHLRHFLLKGVFATEVKCRLTCGISVSVEEAWLRRWHTSHAQPSGKGSMSERERRGCQNIEFKGQGPWLLWLIWGNTVLVLIVHDQNLARNALKRHALAYANYTSTNLRQLCQPLTYKHQIHTSFAHLTSGVSRAGTDWHIIPPRSSAASDNVAFMSD